MKKKKFTQIFENIKSVLGENTWNKPKVKNESISVLLFRSIVSFFGVYWFTHFSVISDLLLMNCQAINITGRFYEVHILLSLTIWRLIVYSLDKGKNQYRSNGNISYLASVSLFFLCNLWFSKFLSGIRKEHCTTERSNELIYVALYIFYKENHKVDKAMFFACTCFWIDFYAWIREDYTSDV